MQSNTDSYMRELIRNQTTLLSEAERSIKRAQRRLRGVSLLLEAWRTQENLPGCLAALGAEQTATPLEAAETALSEFIFDVGDATSSLHDWDRLEQIRTAHAGKEARVT